ncbi:hypothetical protein RB200_01330 [Streptomyces sp. PmtG]
MRQRIGCPGPGAKAHRNRTSTPLGVHPSSSARSRRTTGASLRVVGHARAGRPGGGQRRARVQPGGQRLLDEHGKTGGHHPLGERHMAYDGSGHVHRVDAPHQRVLLTGGGRDAEPGGGARGAARVASPQEHRLFAERPQRGQDPALHDVAVSGDRPLHRSAAVTGR